MEPAGGPSGLERDAGYWKIPIGWITSSWRSGSHSWTVPRQRAGNRFCGPPVLPALSRGNSQHPDRAVSGAVRVDWR
jgi:hypothetical protein